MDFFIKQNYWWGWTTFFLLLSTNNQNCILVLLFKWQAIKYSCSCVLLKACIFFNKKIHSTHSNPICNQSLGWLWHKTWVLVTCVFNNENQNRQWFSHNVLQLVSPGPRWKWDFKKIFLVKKQFPSEECWDDSRRVHRQGNLQRFPKSILEALD